MLANHDLASARIFVLKNLWIHTPMEPAARRKASGVKLLGDWELDILAGHHI